MKILAKRKRGNKFASRCIREFGQVRKGTKEETNPRASRSTLGRVTVREGEQYLLMNI